MKIIKKQKNNKKTLIIIAAILVVVIAASAGAYALYKPASDEKSTSETTDTTNSSKSTIDDKEPTKEQIEAGNATKEDSVNDTNTNDDQNSNKLNLTAIPSNSNQTIHLEVTIKEIIASGACTVTLTNGTISKVYTASVQALSSYSTCTGFDIPTSDLAPGTWKIEVSVVSGSSSGKVNSEVDV